MGCAGCHLGLSPVACLPSSAAAAALLPWLTQHFFLPPAFLQVQCATRPHLSHVLPSVRTPYSVLPSALLLHCRYNVQQDPIYRDYLVMATGQEAEGEGGCCTMHVFVHRSLPDD